MSKITHSDGLFSRPKTITDAARRVESITLPSVPLIAHEDTREINLAKAKDVLNISEQFIKKAAASSTPTIVVQDRNDNLERYEVSPEAAAQLHAQQRIEIDGKAEVVAYVNPGNLAAGSSTITTDAFRPKTILTDAKLIESQTFNRPYTEVIGEETKDLYAMVNNTDQDIRDRFIDKARNSHTPTIVVTENDHMGVSRYEVSNKAASELRSGDLIKLDGDRKQVIFVNPGDGQ